MKRIAKNLFERNLTSKNHRLEDKVGTHEHQSNESLRKVREKDPGHKCQACGKDPYPNYYFCPKCHGHAEFYSDLEDEHSKIS